MERKKGMMVKCKECKSRYYQSFEDRFVYWDAIQRRYYFECSYCDHIIYLWEGFEPVPNQS